MEQLGMCDQKNFEAQTEKIYNVDLLDSLFDATLTCLGWR